MRFPPTAPGRVGSPFLEPGDSVALADRHGGPAGEWVLITPGLVEVGLVVPPDVGPVTRWLAKDSHGRIQWWSDTAWFPGLYAGSTAILPIPLCPRALRTPKPAKPARGPAPEPKLADVLGEWAQQITAGTFDRYPGLLAVANSITVPTTADTGVEAPPPVDPPADVPPPAPARPGPRPGPPPQGPRVVWATQ